MAKIKLNKIVKYLIYSDLVFYTGWGLISPIFAVFILKSIIGGSALVVGIAASINMIVRSIFRIPFGMCTDKNNRTAFAFMFWGLLLTAFIPIGYFYSSHAWHIYALQAILGMSLAMSTAGWTTIFSRHLDKGKESTEWGIDAVAAAGIGPGIAAAVGGVAVTYFSFKAVFLASSIIGLIGASILLAVKAECIKSKMKKSVVHKRLVPRIGNHNHNHY